MGAWEDNRSKTVRDVSKEEHLEWLMKQIEQMEMERGYVAPTIQQRVDPRIRRNGKWVDNG